MSAVSRRSGSQTGSQNCYALVVPKTQISGRRGHGEDSIYLDASCNRYVGAISLGYRPDGTRIRRKVTGRTKQEVRDKLKAARAEPDAVLESSATYTVAQAIDDWLLTGWTAGPTETRTLYEGLMRSLKEHSGSRPLRTPRQ